MKSLVYQVITGERSGAAASVLPLAAGVGSDALWHRRSWLAMPGTIVVPSAARSGALPVVSVGNLTVGGTGKTPCVALLARFFPVPGDGVSPS